MGHAVLIQVTLDPNSDIEHRHSILNEFIIPTAKGLPGFQRGTWMNDGSGVGTCVVMFDTKANADEAIASLTPDGGPPVISVGVHEVEAEASV